MVMILMAICSSPFPIIRTKLPYTLTLKIRNKSMAINIKKKQEYGDMLKLPEEKHPEHK